MRKQINSKRKKPGRAGKKKAHNSKNIQGSGIKLQPSPAKSVVRDIRRTKSSDLVDEIVNSPRKTSVIVNDQINNIVTTNSSDKSAALIRSISGVLNENNMITNADDLDELMSRELSVSEIEEIEDTTSRKLQSQFISMYEDEEKSK